MAILLNINRYNCCNINTISYDWIDSFKIFFTSYSSNDADSRTIILPYYNSYLLFYDLKTSIFEGILNYNNFISFYNLKNLDFKSYFNKENQIQSLKKNLFIRFSDLDLQKS